MTVAQWWKGLLPHKKWFYIGLVFMIPGIIMMRLSYNPESGFGSIGMGGFLLSGIAILILLFVAVPLSIKDWREGKTGFWHD